MINNSIKKDAGEFMECELCGAPGTVVGRKDYNINANGSGSETLVWQCGDPTKLHRWETVKEFTVDQALVPVPALSIDPHLHADKNFAFIDGPRSQEIPEEAAAYVPGVTEPTNGRTEDGLTVKDGTEGDLDTEQQFHQDGSMHHAGESEFSDTRTPASELDASGYQVTGSDEDTTTDEARTTKTRAKGGTKAAAKADPRVSSDEVENPSTPVDTDK